ncbi:MAG: phenylalanine--tRNA ligase subunit beta [Chlamydiota bacterium]
MKIPLSWIKEYLPTAATAQEIADALTLLGIEVEKIQPLSLPFQGVVIAKILAAHPHPHADRLRVATVFDGIEELQIVCAAPNCRAGIKVALAKIGATLQDEKGKSFKIKKGKLRDVESFGMLCAIDELGLGAKTDGILELNTQLPEGTDLLQLYGDTILEISLTPNLGHALSVVGIARELAAHMQCTLHKPSIVLKENVNLPIDKLISVSIEDKAACSHYACRVMQGIKVAPSPDWLKQRLEASGVRSINNVVDISNYIMLEYGQPLHIFDYNTLHGKQITVTSKSTFPTLTTIDGTLREIPQGVCLICDDKEPIAFAGVMGGADSSVNDTTTNILIEAAHFSENAIRKSSKKINLRTDASHRFERGTDPLILKQALNHAAFLIQQIAGGDIAHGIKEEIAVPFTPQKITCRTTRVNQLLGTELSTGEIINFFERLEIHVEKEEAQTLHTIIPSYRNDLKNEIDLVEEAARIYGYNNIDLKPPQYSSSNISDSPIYLFEREVRSLLTACNLTEIHTCDLISPFLSDLTKEHTFSKENVIHVLHPSSIEQSVLRVSLLPGFLQTVKNNFNKQNFTINAFEIGRIHFKEGAIFKEPSMAAILLTGAAAPYHFDPKPEEVDFFDLKGKVENFLQALNISNISFEPSHLRNFHPGRQARIKSKDTILGSLGEVHPTHLYELDIRNRVYFAELNLHDLLLLRQKELHVEALNLYPGSERDWTITLKEECPIGLFLKTIKETSSRLLEDAYLLDLYKSEQIGKDKKNATFRFIYRDKEKTISQETVEQEHARITLEVTKKLRDQII